MKTNKGFTLIELLAVIVILAIIALIATPIILGVIEKAEKGAAEASSRGYIDAVEKQILINEMDDDTTNDIVDGEYTVNGDNIVKGSTSIEVKVKGKPVTGSFTIENGQVISGNFCVNGYSIDYDGKKAEYNKDANYCNEEVVQQYQEKEIKEITQTLLDNNTTYGNYEYMEGTYLKGEQNNNYVWYNGFLWRIMGINSDTSIRLITEENVTGIPWGASNAGNWEATGYIKDWLNNYFYNHLDSSKTSIIKESNWCINETINDVNLREDCTGGTIVSSKVGLISVDEYNLSGASSTNNTYYLTNKQYFWTLTPYNVSNSWRVLPSCASSSNSVASPTGVRPVINVDAEATITAGDGSLGNAYVLNQNTNSKTGSLNDVSSSGEYVSLSNRTYRVVSKEEQGIKLIYDGYYDANDDGIIESTDKSIFNPSTNQVNTFENSTIKTLLNGDVLTWLGNSNKIKEVNWNQGQAYNWVNSYTISLTNAENDIQAKVGLIRVGEMLSGQSASLLTKNYTERSDCDNTQYYWTMTKCTSTSESWYMMSKGSHYNSTVNANFGVRPVIYVDTNTTVTEGNGTLQSPYKID